MNFSVFSFPRKTLTSLQRWRAHLLRVNDGGKSMRMTMVARRRKSEQPIFSSVLLTHILIQLSINVCRHLHTHTQMCALTCSFTQWHAYRYVTECTMRKCFWFDGRVLGKNAHLFWMYIQVHALYKNCIWIWIILIPNGPHLIVGGEGGGGSVGVFQTEPNKIKQSWSLKTGCLWPEIHLHLQKNVSHKGDLKWSCWESC